jgi:uncharacterized phage protein gp47/JayE
MQLPVLTFSGLVEQMAAGVQGTATQLIDLTVGSVLRALLESCASVALWLQWLILQVLASTRAATSTGPDLDSWMADFSFVRLPGAAAAGAVTFARSTVGLSCVVPVGCTVLTSDGSLSFAVIEDDTNPAWNGAGGYMLAAQQASVAVPVQCTTVGPAGNVQAGTVGLLASPIPGVDTVSNAAPFTGGVSAEPDAAFRARFQLYINSRSLATVTAILDAVEAVQQGLRTTVIENVDAALNATPGGFLVVADNGTGSPGTALLSAVQGAVDAVRPIGAVFAVQGPAVVQASVTVVLETSNPLTHAAVAASAQQAILAWIQGLPIAGTLAISRIDALAHAADASVVSVTSTLINGAAQDLTAPVNGVIVPASVVVS